MANPSSSNAPGRLAARWIEDLTARSIPEVESLIAPAIEARLSACGQSGPHRHELTLVKNQTTLEGDKSNPTVLSLVCSDCDHHFLVEIHRHPESTAQLCNHGHATYSSNVLVLPAPYSSQLMHHLVKTKVWSGEDCQQKRSARYPLVGRVEFACSQPNCSMQVSIEVSEPRIPLEWLLLLTDVQRMRRNLEEARENDPARYATTAEETVENALRVLATYLRHLLADAVPRKISRRNKRFQVVFGKELVPLFRAVGYEEHTLDSNGVPEDFLIPQPLEPALQDSPIPHHYLRAYVDNVLLEVENHIHGAALSEAFKAVPRLQRELHCQAYPTSTRGTRNPSDDEPFRLLGVLPSMHETLIHYGYRSQVESCPDNKMEYADAFGQVSTQLESNELLEQAGKDLSLLSAEESSAGQPVASQDHGAIWSAAAYYGLVNPSDGPDWRLVNAYQQKQAEDPATAETHMRALAKHRNSTRLQELLTGQMSLETAMDILDIPKDQVQAISDEFVVSYADVAAENPPMNGKPRDPAWVQEVITALHEIGIRRRSDKLFAKAQEMHAHFTSLAAPPRLQLDTPVGLDNIGNTCYLNSCLQLLYSVEPLRKLLLSGREGMIDLATDEISTRRVGKGKDPVTTVESCLGNVFFGEAGDLFKQLKSTQLRSIKPSQGLAEAALVSAGAITQELEKKKENAQAPTVQQNADSDGLAAPPVPPRRSSDADVRVEHVDFAGDTGDVDMVNVSVDAVSETISTVSSNTLVEDVSEGAKPANSKATGESDAVTADSPPQIPEDIEMTDTAEMTLSALDPTARLKAVLDACSRMRTRESGTDQQDVEETMGSMLSLIQFAVKPREVTSDGVQEDLIMDLFYLTRNYFIKKDNEEEFRCTETSADRSIVAYPAENGPCTIYEALGRGLDIETLDSGQQRFSTLAQLPPVLLVHIQRTKTSGAKNSNPVLVDEMLYLDRFMDTTFDSRLMQLRRCGWHLQDRLDKFANNAPQETPASGPVNKPSAADLAEEDAAAGEVSQSLLVGRPADELQLSSETFSFDIQPDSPENSMSGDVESESLQVEGLPTLTEIKSQSEQALRETRDTLDQLYSNDRKEAYRLHAVICHSGGLNAGHYWIWIYDAKVPTWRKFNDSLVTAEPNSQKVFETLNQGDAPYFLCYVRDEVAEDYVSIPARRAEATISAPDANDVNGSNILATDIQVASTGAHDAGITARQNTPQNMTSDEPPPYSSEET